MKKILVVLVLPVIIFSCAGPTHLYDGDPLEKDKLGHYSVFGSAGVFTKSQIYTLKIDDLDLYDTTKNIWGQVYLAPGEHEITLSFLNYDWNVLPIAEFDENYFKGEYKVKFLVRPGYKYMPMFNLERKGYKDFFNKLCVSENIGTAGWGALKNENAIIACSSANIEVIPENFGCRSTPPKCKNQQGKRE